MKLSKMKRVSKEEFIRRAKEVHGDKYDYSHVDFFNMTTKVCIICPTHGEFWQEPKVHCANHGCPLCKAQKQSLTTEEFVKKARKIHGNKYNYSKVKYVDTNTKICIICPIHGEFWQTPKLHLSGQGCKLCGYNSNKEKQRYSLNWFLDKAKKVHGDKYDYSKVNYVNNRTKVCIICPKHGEFWQTPKNHLNGQGCHICRYMIIAEKEKDDKESFIKKSQKVHGNKYDYSKVKYVNSQTKVCIICPIHGEFYQKPNDHVNGHGCARCRASRLENEIRLFLGNNSIVYSEQFKKEWLGKQSLDFYLPEYNVAIECQGDQHFSPIKMFGGEKTLKITQERDSRKRKLCEENGIKLLYYSNLHIDYPYKVYEDKNELLNEIIKDEKSK